MKFFGGLLVIVMIYSVNCQMTATQLERVVEYSRECRKQTGATIEMITRAVAGDFVDDPKLKDQLLCISKKIGFQDPSGSIDVGVMKVKLGSIIHDDQKTDDLIGACAIASGSPSDTAFESIKCYFEKGGVNIIG